MKSQTIIAAAIALAATASASALPAVKISNSFGKRDTSYTMEITGTNSEGGGGPGQQPLDNDRFVLGIYGGSGYGNDSPSQSEGNFSFTIAAADYGGDCDVDIEAHWQFTGNSWSSCSANGVAGTIGPQDISSGTVSTTTQSCTAVFAC